MDKAKAARTAKQIQDSATRLRTAAWEVENALNQMEFFGGDPFKQSDSIPPKVWSVEAELAELTRQVKALNEAIRPKQD